MNDELIADTVRSYDKTARFCTLIGIAYFIVGTMFMLLYRREMGMIIFYLAYVSIVLTPIVYLYLVSYIPRSTERRLRMMAPLPSRRSIVDYLDPIVLAPLFLGLLYSVPLLILSSHYKQLRTSLDTAGLAPFIWLLGINYLLYARIWRRHGRSHLNKLLSVSRSASACEGEANPIDPA